MNQHDTVIISTDDPSLARDMHSKALLCTDRGALERSRRQRATHQGYRRLETEVRELRDLIALMQEQLAQVRSLYGR